MVEAQISVCSMLKEISTYIEYLRVKRGHGLCHVAYLSVHVFGFFHVFGRVTLCTSQFVHKLIMSCCWLLI